MIHSAPKPAALVTAVATKWRFQARPPSQGTICSKAICKMPMAGLNDVALGIVGARRSRADDALCLKHRDLLCRYP